MTMREEDSFQKALLELEQSEPTEADLQAAYDRARSIGVFLVEKYAREGLRNNPDLGEFVMGMGCDCFWTADGDEQVDTEYASPNLAQLLLDWDEYLKLTGEPMRFTADGPVRRDW